MPVLTREHDVFPDRLFDERLPDYEPGRVWRVVHTKPRQEKSLARDLYDREIPFCLLLCRRRLKVRGKLVLSYIPLFTSYLFLLASDQERILTLATNRVVRVIEVADQDRLKRDLAEIRRLIETGAPITPEDRLAPGVTVEIQSGPLEGMRGKIVRTASKKRFVVEVDFIQRGASVELDDYTLTVVV